MILSDVTAAWSTVTRSVLVQIQREEPIFWQANGNFATAISQLWGCGVTVSISLCRREGTGSTPVSPAMRFKVWQFRNLIFSCKDALVVQRTERDPAKVEAAGSNPAEST